MNGELERQVRLIMMMIDELAPGSVCMDTACPTRQPVPHMANDAGAHPHPYSERPPHSASAWRKIRRDRRKLASHG